MKSFIKVASYVVINLAIVHSACPVHSVSSAGACYWTVPEGTETAVINSCQADGGLLASITDLSVMDFLNTNYYTTLNQEPQKFQGFYIGVNDKSSENTFVNYEGTDQTWTNWDTSEPNDDNSPPQDCVLMMPISDYKWKDTSCDNSAAGLCFIRFAETTVASETTTLPDHTTIDLATTTVDTTTDLTTAGTTTTDKFTTETTPLVKLPTTTETLGTTQLHTTSTDVATQQSSTLNQVAETTVASETTTLPDHTTIDLATTTVVTTTDLTTAGTTTTDKFTTETTSLAKLPTTTETLGTTQLHTTSTDVATQQSSTLNQGTNNQECLCVCYSTHPTINSAELQEKINKLIEELTISKKDTSQNKRKLTSASDNRTSAKSIGYVGASILILVGSFIIGLDALNLCKPKKSK